MDDETKEKNGTQTTKSSRDSFKKIVISKSYGKSWIDEDEIFRINLIDFLLDENSLDR